MAKSQQERSFEAAGLLTEDIDCFCGDRRHYEVITTQWQLVTWLLCLQRPFNLIIQSSCHSSSLEDSIGNRVNFWNILLISYGWQLKLHSAHQLINFVGFDKFEPLVPVLNCHFRIDGAVLLLGTNNLPSYSLGEGFGTPCHRYTTQVSN